MLGAGFTLLGTTDPGIDVKPFMGQKTTMKTKVKAKFVVGYQDGNQVIIKNREVIYEGDMITFVGQNYPGDVDDTIDAGNAMVYPGFIDLNALANIDHDLIHLEAPPEIQKNLLWSEEYYRKSPREVMTQEEEAFKSLYAYTQLIRHGITTARPITSVFYYRCAETYEELAAAVDHAGTLGLRIYLRPSYQSGARVVKPNGSMEVYFDEKKVSLDSSGRWILSRHSMALMTDWYVGCWPRNASKPKRWTCCVNRNSEVMHGVVPCGCMPHKALLSTDAYASIIR